MQLPYSAPSPARKSLTGFTNPEENLARLGIRPGSYVADLGTGSGHYSFALSRQVGEDGRVYAIEIQKELCLRTKNEAREKRLNNVEVFRGDIAKLGGTTLRDNSIDVVILSNVLFQVENREGVIAEGKRILKQNGRMLVIDWKGSFGGIGPEPDSVLTVDAARELLAAAGLSFAEAFSAGNYHYGLIYRKP